ncbi:MAG: CBS domain-containing protein [Planctomycetales bacterium]|nr:CBS domain-containing protein [Planctomycetales bacterium]
MHTETTHTETIPMARDVMNSSVHCVQAEMRLEEIVDFLLKHKISNAPVVRVDGSRKSLLGFISEGDCMNYLVNEMFYGNPCPTQTAETMMKKHPTCVEPDTDIFTLTSIFMSRSFRHLPVVDAEQNLVGIVSRRDILRTLDKYYREWTRSHDRQRFPVDIHKIMNHRFIVTS